MTKKEIINKLLPGFIVGFLLGFVLTNLVGVDSKNVIPNYVGGAMCCLVPTLLNCIIVLKSSASYLQRKLPMKKALVRSLPFVLLAALVGLFIVAIVVEKVLGIDTRTINVLTNSIYESILGVIVSTLFAYIALKKYLNDVKYTRKDK